MKRRLIGVWISAALAILLLSFWLGSMLGSRVARYWYGHHQLGAGILSGPERMRVESELAYLSAVQTLEVYAVVTQNDKDLRGKYLEIKGLEEIKQRSNIGEIRPWLIFTSDSPT